MSGASTVEVPWRDGLFPYTTTVIEASPGYDLEGLRGRYADPHAGAD